MIDLAALGSPEGKEIYYYEALQSQSVLDALVDHYDASRTAMVESGVFAESEAAAMAASIACGALASTIKNLGDSRNITLLDRIDSYIRQVHGIRPVIYPRQHEDPLVQAFYENLEPHLLKSLPGDRADPWHS